MRKTHKTADSECLSRIGDVIIPTSGETPEEIATATCVMLPDVILAGDLNIYRSNTIDGRIVSYIINHVVNADISRIAQGKSVVHIKADELSKIQIHYPTQSEQAKLLNFLHLLDAKIEKQQLLVERIKSYKRGALQHIFASIKRKLPLYQISEYYSSENTMSMIESIPAGIYPVYDAGGVVAKINKFDFNEAYVAIIKDGSGVGRLQLCEPRSSIIGTLGALFPKNCSVGYLYAVLQTIDYRQFVTGMAIPHIYYKDYKSIEVPFPDDISRNNIERLLNSIDTILDKESKLLNLLQLKKTSLLQQLFI